VNDNQISVHWSDLPKDELTRFCQDVDAGTQGNFLIAPVKKLTRRNAVSIPQKPNVRTRPGIARSIIKSSPDSSVMPTIAW
jgi:hypothetical protein